MPKRQHPVKIELFHRLQEPERFEAARHRAEADGFAQDGRAEMQERELAEAGGQAPAADPPFPVGIAFWRASRSPRAPTDLVGEARSIAWRPVNTIIETPSSAPPWAAAVHTMP